MIQELKDMYETGINPKNKSMFRKEADRRRFIYEFNTSINETMEILHNAKVKAEIKAHDIEVKYKRLLESLKETK